MSKQNKASDFFKDFNKTNIENVASEQTERKEPTYVNENEKKPITQSEKTKFFNTVPEAEVINESDTETEQPKKEISENAGKAEAFLIGSGVELVFGFIEKLMFVKKFTKEEKARFLIIDSTPENELSEEDINLNRKFLSVTKKHEKIREKIDLDKKEMDALEMACAEYTKLTGKSLSPSVVIWSTIGKIFVGRAMDIFL